MKHSSLLGRWRHVAAVHRDRVAIVTPDDAPLTFGETDELVSVRAEALTAHVPQSTPVAVIAESTRDGLLAFLSVLLSGRPLVPLDPLLPEDRRRAIVERAGARVLHPRDLATMEAAPGVRLKEVGEDDPAVVLFTSGSTGVPKAVVHPQKMWLGQADECALHLELTENDRVGHVLPSAFGAGLDVLVMTLFGGAALHYADPRQLGAQQTAAWIAQCEVTTLHCTPALLRGLLRTEALSRPLPSLRLVTTCGEAIRSSEVAALREKLLPPDGTYTSWSGSSETGNLAFNPYPPARRLPEGSIPVGTPGVNKSVVLLDENGDEVPVGSVGEVHVDSNFLASGYLDDEALTVSRFRRLPDGRVRYRMGDLARIDSRGQLHLLGRSDDAVKIRGYLVEPAEIETAVLSHPRVEECAVLARAEDGGIPVVAAFHAGVPGASRVTESELREHLAQKLPTWMMPTRFVSLDALPRTERGKVDRSRLVIPDHTRDIEAPLGRVETRIADLWARVLDLDAVGRHENPFDLGADSLALQRVLSDLRSEFGVHIQIGRAVSAPGVVGLARLVTSARPGSGPLPATAVSLSATTRGAEHDATPVWCFCGAGGNATSFVHLARELGPTYATYALQQQGLENRAFPDLTMAAMVRRHVSTIRRVQRHGPYRLVGHSLGGFLALEAARVLQDAGETIESVVVLDTLLPESVVTAHRCLSSAELRRRTVATDAQAAVPSLPERLRTHWRVYTAGLLRRDAALQEQIFWEHGARVGNRYRPASWHGDAVVFLTDDNDDDPRWWSSIVTGAVRTYRVSGDHLSVLRSPTIRQVADAVGAAAVDTGKLAVNSS